MRKHCRRKRRTSLVSPADGVGVMGVGGVFSFAAQGMYHCYAHILSICGNAVLAALVGLID